ncbi:MAG: FixH family protein [Pseudomonadota bacterium]
MTNAQANIETGYQESGFRFTGWHMLACMVAFFGVIIVVNFTMATMASRSWTGLVVKNSYVASQKFNRELAAAKAQKASGWRSDVTYSDGELSIALNDKTGALLPLESVFILIGRPAFEQLDQRLAATVSPSGTATLKTELAPGEWSLRIDATVDGRPYRRDARMFVNGQGKGIVQ